MCYAGVLGQHRWEMFFTSLTMILPCPSSWYLRFSLCHKTFLLFFVNVPLQKFFFLLSFRIFPVFLVLGQFFGSPLIQKFIFRFLVFGSCIYLLWPRYSFSVFICRSSDSFAVLVGKNQKTGIHAGAQTCHTKLIDSKLLFTQAWRLTSVTSFFRSRNRLEPWISPFVFLTSCFFFFLLIFNKTQLY